jgi:hypothetical protein
MKEEDNIKMYLKSWGVRMWTEFIRLKTASHEGGL